MYGAGTAYARAIVTALVRRGIAWPEHPPGDICVCIKDKSHIAQQ